MSRERDLFRAIVLSGIAAVGGVACGSSTPDPDGGGGLDGAMVIDSGRRDAPAADAPAVDAPSVEDAGEDAMVIIL